MRQAPVRSVASDSLPGSASVRWNQLSILWNSCLWDEAGSGHHVELLGREKEHREEESNCGVQDVLHLAGVVCLLAAGPLHSASLS